MTQFGPSIEPTILPTPSRYAMYYATDACLIDIHTHVQINPSIILKVGSLQVFCYFVENKINRFFNSLQLYEDKDKDKKK